MPTTAATPNVPRRPLSGGLIVGVILGDSLFKFFVHRWLPATGIPLFPGVTVRLFENTRGPFGLLPLWLTVVVSVIVLLGLGYWWKNTAQPNEERMLRRSLSLLTGGGMANLGERFLFGRTTDVLWIGEFTALNVADLAIIGALLGILVASWRELSTRLAYRSRSAESTDRK